MSIELIAAIVAGLIGLLVLIAVGMFIVKRFPRRLKLEYFQQKWQELQRLCASTETWPDAIIEADRLLDEALKKRRFSGKSMGERLVSAQRLFTDNDAMWFGHKLRNKLEQDRSVKLRQSDVKAALIGIRQALKDIGAL